MAPQIIHWLVPGEWLGYLIMTGMVAALVAALLVQNPLLRMALASVVVLGMSFQIHRHGTITERQKWERAAKREDTRQVDANKAADTAAELDIEERKRQLDLFERDLKQMQKEAEDARDAGEVILGPDDVSRLNRLRGR